MKRKKYWTIIFKCDYKTMVVCFVKLILRKITGKNQSW